MENRSAVLHDELALSYQINNVRHKIPHHNAREHFLSISYISLRFVICFFGLLNTQPFMCFYVNLLTEFSTKH